MRESCFSASFFQHVFHGRVWDRAKLGAERRQPTVSGFHYEGAGMASIVGAQVLNQTRSKKDRRGVYNAVVRISRDGVEGKKRTTFFPAEWTRQQVLEAIREVYEQRPAGNRGWGWEGRSRSGVYIFMLIDQEQKIVTAYPKREYCKPSRLRHNAKRVERRRLARMARAVITQPNVARVEHS